MDDSQVQAQLSRLEGLLRSGKPVAGLEPGEPEATAESVGAVAAVGYRVPELGIRASVFVFESWARHSEVVAELKQRTPPGPDDYVTSSTNGPMLFVGRVSAAGERGLEAKMMLARLTGNFSGDE